MQKTKPKMFLTGFNAENQTKNVEKNKKLDTSYPFKKNVLFGFPFQTHKKNLEKN